MQVINSTVIRELSTIIFFRELISCRGLYLWGGGGGLYPGTYNRRDYIRGLTTGAYIRGVYIPGAYIRRLIPVHISPGAFSRGL